MHRRIVSSLIAALLCLMLGNRPAAAIDPIDIHVILALTGPAAFVGKENVISLGIIEKYVNAHGGIRGRPIHFAIQDDASTQQITVQLVNGLIAKHVPVMIGPNFTSDCTAIVPLVRDNGPVEYCLSPGIHPVRGGYTFSATVGFADYAVVIARYLRARGFTRVAVLTSTDATGQDFDRGWDATMRLPENKGISVVAREYFNNNDLSIVAQAARIKASNAQFFINWTAGTAFGTVLHGYRDAGLDIPIAATNANMIYAQLEQYKDFMPRELLFPAPRGISETGTLPGPIRDKQNVFFGEYAKLGIKPSIPGNFVWDVAFIVIDALKALGPDASPEKIRDWIRNQHGWVGINGVYDYGDAEQRGLGPYALVMYHYNPYKPSFDAVSKPGGSLK